jgi:hypothetical protein
MSSKHHSFLFRIFCTTFASYALMGYSVNSLAWDRVGHSTVGIMALSQFQPDARRALESFVNPLDEQAMVKACNWPDEFRETEAGAWSSPLHYINIPRGDFTYLASRDCPQQQCVTEAIKHYAVELADRQASQQQRWQAFAWLCHLVGDLHQPLHAGYADDRGGNDFNVIFKGEQINLHTFWDFVLINQHADNWQNLISLLSTSPDIHSQSEWSANMVNDWTNESHKLARLKVYPVNREIDDIYLQQSWELVQERIISAASRLALIINSELKDVN